MPIYEYVCGKCGDHLEVIQKMDDKPLTRCAKCKGKLQKAVSRSSFAFKGSGWYVTDYAKSGASGKEASAKSETSTKDAATSKGESASSDTTTSTSKTAAKADSPAPASTTSSKTKGD